MSTRVQSSAPQSYVSGIFDQILDCIQGGPSRILAVASTAVALGLDQVAPAHHDMRSHIFKPGQCIGGRLSYQGDVPVLTLDSDDPFVAGRAQGYLCGNALHELAERFDAAVHTLDKQPRASQLPRTIAAFRRVISREYLQEMEGLVEGYRDWAKQYSVKPVDLTVDELILTQLLPEACHFNAAEYEGIDAPQASGKRTVACSVIIDRDPEKGFVFARNLDWPSLRIAGSHSLVVHRKHSNGLLDTVGVALPGMIGTLTGMNAHGVSVAMNVCSGDTKEVDGMPSTLFNRKCVEQCKTAKEIEEFVQTHSPLGPYHLSVADEKEAFSIHFYQSPRGTHVIRRWASRKPLVTLNCRYSPRPNTPLMEGDGRQRIVNEFLKNRRDRPLEEALALEEVNNDQTIHRVVMEPKTRTLKVAFDDAFAGNQALQTAAVFDAPARRSRRQPVAAVAAPEGSKENPIEL
jgi:hypothetical protein